MVSLSLDGLRRMATSDLRFVVIGDPIDHSLSPPMQNAGLQFLRIPYRYDRLRVRPEDLGEAFQILREREFFGWNLTLPHKLQALELVDELDPLAARLRAVNTVVNRSGKLFGFNTDGTGLVAAMSESFACNVSSFRIGLLGAGGGAGQAAARYLASLNVPVLVLVNRTIDKAEVLAAELTVNTTSEIKAQSWENIPSVFDEVDLIVNAATVGPGPELLTGISSRHLVFDMVYGSQETALVRFARTRGARSADGLLMLLYQGVFAFEIWCGKPAPVDQMRSALFAAASRA